MTETWQQLARPLPIRTPLFGRETTASYIRRVAESNGLDPRALIRHLGRGGTVPARPADPVLADIHRVAREHRREMRHMIDGLRAARGKAALEYIEKIARDHAFDNYDVLLNDAALQRLAAMSNYPVARLTQTLSPPRIEPAVSAQPLWKFAKLVAVENAQVPCTLCTAARGISGRAVVRLPTERIICLTHARWIANPPHPIYPHKEPESQQQFTVASLPEILSAARRHRRLARLHGPAATAAAFHDAHESVTRVPLLFDDEFADRWEQRIKQLSLDLAEPTLTHVIRYPETVICTSILLSPYWTRAARRLPPDVVWEPLPGIDPENRSGWDNTGPPRPHAHDFENELRRRLGLTRESSIGVDGIEVYARGRAWRHLPQKSAAQRADGSVLSESGPGRTRLE